VASVGGGSGGTLPQVDGGSSGGSQGSDSDPNDPQCVIMMRETNNCSNNQGRCVYDTERTTAVCRCYAGFSGELCQNVSFVTK